MCSLNRKDQESVLSSAVPARDVIPVDTWDKLFVFQSEFDAYNAKGMLEADPQGERWCSEKQCFDYTPFVTRADWLSRFREQHQREINATLLRRDRTRPHRYISAQWACTLEAEATELGRGGGAQGYKLSYGSGSNIWQAVVPEATDAQDAFQMAMDLAYSPAAPYEAFTRRDWERNCQYWNTRTYKEVLEKYRLRQRDDWLSKSPPTSFWETWCAVSSWAVPPERLLWVGGTYARHPSQFPPEQHRSAWIFERFRPLGIQPSGFMQKLRRGAKDHALDSNQHLVDEDENFSAPAVPHFPFSLTPQQQESMLSAHLWKHDLPSVWYGEGPQFEMRRERYKRIKFYVERRGVAPPVKQDDEGRDLPERETEKRTTLADFLDIVHDRHRDRFRQPQYEEWLDRVGNNIVQDVCGKLTDPRLPQLSRQKNFPRNWKWGLELRKDTKTHDSELSKIAARKWSTAPAFSANAGATAGALSLEGMLGPGLPYPKQLVIPSETTVVDILALLPVHAGVTDSDQIAME